MLLEHGAVDGLPDLRGRNPADLARSNGHTAVAKVLNEGATLKVRTSFCGQCIVCPAQAAASQERAVSSKRSCSASFARLCDPVLSTLNHQWPPSWRLECFPDEHWSICAALSVGIMRMHDVWRA